MYKADGGIWSIYAWMDVPATLSPFRASRSHTMADGSETIFKDGKLKPGVYKIQNIVGHTYVDIQEHVRELCCRPATVLEGKGLVGSRPQSTLIAVVMSYGHSSGKFTLLVPVIPSAGCSVQPLYSFPPTEQRNAARTRRA